MLSIRDLTHVHNLEKNDINRIEFLAALDDTLRQNAVFSRCYIYEKYSVWINVIISAVKAIEFQLEVPSLYQKMEYMF